MDKRWGALAREINSGRNVKQIEIGGIAWRVVCIPPLRNRYAESLSAVLPPPPGVLHKRTL
jgi:hypothetical protein